MINHIFHFSQSFNAKSTSKNSLCESFIPNDYFDRLISPNHTIMIGPRGSGKTTLLRMCDIEAMDIWKSEKSDDYRKRVEFTGVFVPTDRFWKVQYDRIKDFFNNDKSVMKILNSSFLYHVLESFCNSLIYKVSYFESGSVRFRNVSLSKSHEAELVYTLADIWKVKFNIPSLRGLAIALSIKKYEISNYISSMESEGCIGEFFDVLDSNIIQLLEVSVQIVNQFIGTTDEKWCFLFDELELAPDIFVQPLIDAMRGGPQNILFKLALSPYHRGISITSDPSSTMHKQDVSFINLSGVKYEGEGFAKALAESVFRREGLVDDIESYFEENEIDRNKDISELSYKDNSFSDYLERMGLKGCNYSDLSTEQKSIIRRIQFNVHLRNYYKKDQLRKQGRRRPSHYYSGFLNICRILEYNPRMIIGVMSIFSGVAKAEGEVKVYRQLKCIEDYYKSFKSLLNTIAIESENRKYETLFDVIESIAKYFADEIHGEQFSPDPRGSIVFKNEFNEHYFEAVGLAMNAGALISDKVGTDRKSVV